MIDWKILAAGFVALLFVSSVLVGNFGLKDFVNKIVGGVEGIFGGTTFTEFTSTPTTGSKEITVVIYPTELTLPVEQPADITVGGTLISGFQGTIDITGTMVLLKEANSKLVISLPGQKVDISKLSLKRFSASDIKFLIEPNIFSPNGSLEIMDFGGLAELDTSLKLIGNVSRARVILEGNKWELV